MKIKKVFRQSLLAFVTLILVACSQNIPIKLYVLESSEEPFSAENLPKKTLRLADVILPDYLDRRDVVLHDQAGILEVNSLHQWSEPLDRGIKRVLRDILVPRLIQSDYYLSTERDNIDVAPTLTINIQRLDVRLNAKVTLVAYWQVRTARDNLLLQGTFADSLPSGQDYSSIVNAQSDLIRKFALYLAERLNQELPNSQK